MNGVLLLEGVEEWSPEVHNPQAPVPLQHCAQGYDSISLQVSRTQPQELDGAVDLQHGGHTDASPAPHLAAMKLKALHRLVQLQDIGQLLHTVSTDVRVAQIQHFQTAGWVLHACILQSQYYCGFCPQGLLFFDL